jgi:hypothetical protein
MNWQGEEKRSGERFPFERPATYATMGQPDHAPTSASRGTEIVDLSDMGMRIQVKGDAPEQGDVLRVRVPVLMNQASVPTLAQVRWKEKIHGYFQVGLYFLT